MKSKLLKSPTKLIGAKSRIRHLLYPMFPQHTKYLEPFLGSGTVLLGKSKASREVVGDINRYNINFWSCLQQDPDRLYNLIQVFLQDLNKERWIDYRDRLSTETNPISQAVLYYIINKASVNGIVRFNLKGACNSSYCGTTKGRGWLTRPWLDEVYERIKDVRFLNADYTVVLNRAGDDTFSYIDPPYYKCWTSYDKVRFSVEDHIDLKWVLTDLPGKWMLSINDYPEVRELYKGFNIKELNCHYSCSQTAAGRGPRPELIITNYKVD